MKTVATYAGLFNVVNKREFDTLAAAHQWARQVGVFDKTTFETEKMALFFVKVTGRGIDGFTYLAHNGYTALTMVGARGFSDKLDAQNEIAAYKKLGYVQKFEVVEL